ncbi:RNB domain-containing protein [Entamoeba marina]
MQNVSIIDLTDNSNNESSSFIGSIDLNCDVQDDVIDVDIDISEDEVTYFSDDSCEILPNNPNKEPQCPASLTKKLEKKLVDPNTINLKYCTISNFSIPNTSSASFKRNMSSGYSICTKPNNYIDFIESNHGTDTENKYLPVQNNLLKTHDVIDADENICTDVDSLFGYERYKKSSRNSCDDLYRIKTYEYNVRTNLTHRRVFTIDGEETRCRDDAIHVEQINDNLFEVGIHTADCTNFFSYTSSQCMERIKTHVNSRNRKCNHISQHQKDSFSLDSGKLRRAVSLILHFNKHGKLVEKPKVCRSIIEIKCNFSYEQVSGLLNNKAIGDPFKWESYGVVPFKICGALHGVTLPQLKVDLINIFNVVFEQMSQPKKKNDKISPSTIIKDIGIYINNVMADYLESVYGEYALIFTKYHTKTTSFRSPLRKFFDFCAVRQITSATLNHTTEQMAKFVISNTPEVFKKFIRSAQQSQRLSHRYFSGGFGVSGPKKMPHTRHYERIPSQREIRLFEDKTRDLNGTGFKIFKKQQESSKF